MFNFQLKIHRYAIFSEETTEAALDENLLPEKMLLGLRLTVGEDQVRLGLLTTMTLKLNVVFTGF
jgi:hypothetical protein